MEDKIGSQLETTPPITNTMPVSVTLIKKIASSLIFLIISMISITVIGVLGYFITIKIRESQLFQPTSKTSNPIPTFTVSTPTPIPTTVSITTFVPLTSPSPIPTLIPKWYYIEIFRKSGTPTPTDRFAKGGWLKVPIANLLWSDVDKNQGESTSKILKIVNNIKEPDVYIWEPNGGGKYYILISEGEIDTTKLYQNDTYTLKISKPENESELLPFLSNDKYCRDNSDCTIRYGECNYGSLNNFKPVYDFPRGCTVTFDAETGEAVVGGELHYDGAKCENNICKGINRQIIPYTNN